ncbi:hypothetical protein JZK55_18190 [Dissulfurispira thermophila]|uniref:diguanylate cyclase n=1 Tax=Dissulfurispira thermophila TaxID=2715679 RepID=A0A7G1H5A2_9BACT|nr:diguanylate cyclase [Dissulfurispira thermophila]BCB96897.1 hypothetical protein JZK55_18190 [Dissulfurispira thermophila]
MIGLCLKDIVCRKDICLNEGATLKQAIDLMESNGKGVVVILKDAIPIGILTERDIVEIVYSGTDINSPAIKYATKNLITTHETKAIGYALNLIVSNNIRRIIVVDKSGSFIGVITQQDMVKHLEDDFYRSTLKIRHVIEKMQPLIYIDQDSSLNDAIKKMIENKVSAVPILKDSKAVGIITEKDILKVVKNGISLNSLASEFMSHPVITVRLDEPVTHAVEIMNTKNIRRVVVVNSNSTAVAIVTHRDLLRNLESTYTEFIERKLKHTKDILNFLPEMVMEIIDAEEGQAIIWANERALNRFGMTIINKPITDFIPSDKWAIIYGTLCKLGRAENIKVKKDDFIYELSGFFIKTEADLCAGKIQLIIRDITDEVRLYTTDPLTGLYNRRFLNEFLHKELELSKRYHRQLSLAIADIDDFKKLNDTYGHVAGDVVLKAIAKTMLKNVRDSDVVSRYGGEEFVIVMSEIGKETALKAIERIREAISQEKISLFDGSSISITISSGIASYPDDADSSVDLLIAADDRLYKAKREGKNRTIYS